MAKKYSIFALSETWLNENVLDSSIHIQGYDLVRFDRGSRGGGVAFYIDSKFKYSQIEVSPNIEQLWVSVSLKGKSYAVGVVYRPPHSNYKHFTDELEESLCSAMLHDEKVICLGDVNINFMDTGAASTKYLTEMLNSTSMHQIIDEVTHITNQTGTLIDVILCNDPSIIESKQVGGLDLTYHELISCRVQQHKLKTEPLFYTYRSFKNFDITHFLDDLQKLSLINICYLSDIEDKIELFNRLITDLFNKHIPLKTSKITKAKAPWLNDEIRSLMIDRDKARSAFRKHPISSNWEKYKTLKNRTNHKIVEEKRKYLIKLHRVEIRNAYGEN
nr:unnamed protein product [Callosobruchus chinensis]